VVQLCVTYLIVETALCYDYKYESLTSDLWVIKRIASAVESHLIINERIYIYIYIYEEGGRRDGEDLHDHAHEHGYSGFVI